MQAIAEALPVVHHHNVWIAYFAGFGLTLLFKWAKAVYFGKKNGVSTRDTTLNWFFEPSIPNVTSWTATIGGVWILGSIYIEHIVEISGLTSLPVDASIAFFMGTIFEFTIPAITKWFVSKIPTESIGGGKE